MKNCESVLNLLREREILVAEHTDLMHVPYPDPVFSGFQGGCSDGERYYYLALMHYELDDRTKDYSCIAKIDLWEKKVIKYSRVLHLGHANDVAYHPKKNLLMVVNNKPHPTRVTLIHPETLEIVGYEELTVPIYALEYNAERDCYVAGISGTRQFCILDGDLKPVDGKAFRMERSTDRYTKQGLCADGNLVYFILWDGKHKAMEDFQNLIAMYDWDGNYKGVLHFNVGVQEPENLSIVNGEVISVCGKGVPILYHFAPKATE